jgi:stage V sporulation protein B
VLRKSAPLVVATAIFVLASYAVTVFLGRHLGPAEYGVLGVVTSLMTALNVMQTSGVPQAMAKFIAEDEDHADDVLLGGLRLQLLLSVALVVLFIAISPALARLFHEPSLPGYIVLAALVLPGYGLFTAYAGYFQGLHRFGAQARLYVVYAIAKVVFIIGLALVFGLAGALVGYVLATFAAALSGFRPPHAVGRFDTRRLVALSLPLIGFSALALLQYQVDLFTVKASRHAVDAGYYVAAQSVSVIPFFGLAALGQVLLPSVSRHLARNEPAQAAAATSQAVRYLLLLLLPATALIAGSARQVVLLLFGEAYRPAVSVLRVLVLSYIAVTGFALLASVLNGAGRARTSMWLAALGVAVSLALCPWWVHLWGLVGAAIGMGAGALIAMVGAALAVRRAVRFGVGPATVVRVGVASGVVYGLARVPLAPWTVLVSWPVLLVLFAGLVWVSGEVTADERRQVHELWHLARHRGRSASAAGPAG